MLDFNELRDSIKGKVFTDSINKIIYSTDASAYKEEPAVVCIPEDIEDLKSIIRFSNKHKTGIIPRAAGTSLAGQVVGNGIIVDISKNFNRIIEVNKKEKWVRLQPGVVLDELNKELSEDNLFFGPETSTSNRCMIGGMVGNNSCGAHSLIYGSTREHVLELKCLLSDSTEVVFGELSKSEYYEKCRLPGLEGDIYRHIDNILSDKTIQREIDEQYPDKNIKRRNTGYALDVLLDCDVFGNPGKKFNLCKLLTGSEGTLAFITEIKLNLVDLPPKSKALMCIHTKSLDEVFEANLIALNHFPVSIELMDKKVLDLTKENINQNRNRFFIDGDPAAILIVEWISESIEEINLKARNLETDLRKRSLGYSYVMIYGNDIPKVWSLRKAGLGVLTNLPGDAKPVPVTEDTAINPVDLKDYINEFDELLRRNNLDCVYYAHIGTGELHLRPILNLKDPHDVALFRKLAGETAMLVKKYKGSLSGEHGDGRLRGEFIPLMLGQKIYNLFLDLKRVWDPCNIFNPHKIVNTPKMNSHLRYPPEHKTREFETYFDFSSYGGLVRSIEKCNGSGDCRKSHIIGGTLCPSYQVTKDEKNSTRARANLLREIINNQNNLKPLTSHEIYDILDLCLMCKACKSECPSGVDIAKVKMEFLQHYYDHYNIPLRTRAVAYLPRLHKIASFSPSLANIFLRPGFISKIIKKMISFHDSRNFPLMSSINLNKWSKRHINDYISGNCKKTIYLFNDEFTNYLESEIGITAIKLFSRMGYNVKIAKTAESGRTWLSKGLIKTAKKIVNKNIGLLKDIITEETPLIGLEPSAILSFRDEYTDLAYPGNRETARYLAENCLMFDEFISREIDCGNITPEMFTTEKANVKFHGHCQQKSLITTKYTHKILSLPVNYIVTEIPSGCCGMAGSFGYEKEHHEISMKIGELVLFPTLRNCDENTIISAVGTSCRCQIKDGTGLKALHPLEVLYDALYV